MPRELDISQTTLAIRLGVSVTNVGFSAERGEIIIKEGHYFLKKSYLIIKECPVLRSIAIESSVIRCGVSCKQHSYQPLFK